MLTCQKKSYIIYSESSQFYWLCISTCVKLSFTQQEAQKIKGLCSVNYIQIPNNCTASLNTGFSKNTLIFNNYLDIIHNFKIQIIQKLYQNYLWRRLKTRFTIDRSDKKSIKRSKSRIAKWNLRCLMIKSVEKLNINTSLTLIHIISFIMGCSHDEDVNNGSFINEIL